MKMKDINLERAEPSCFSYTAQSFLSRTLRRGDLWYNNSSGSQFR